MPVDGLTLDTGALIALEHGDEHVRALLAKALATDIEIHVPAGVVAQAWRGNARQALLARLLNSVEIHIAVMDDIAARTIGIACGKTGHTDIVDVHVVVHALEQGHNIVTSDPGDIAKIDPDVPIIAI